MFRIYLNVKRYGTNETINFNICTEKDLEKYSIAEEDCTFDLQSKLYAVSFGGLTRMELAMLAGINVQKVDFAVPIDWQQKRENAIRWENGEWALWDYSNNSWGAPIWSREIELKAKKRVNDKVSDIISKQYSS